MSLQCHQASKFELCQFQQPYKLHGFLWKLLSIYKFIGTKLILIGRHMIGAPWIKDPLITYVTNNNWKDIYSIWIFFYNYCITKIRSFVVFFFFMFCTISHIMFFFVVIEILVVSLGLWFQSRSTFLIIVIICFVLPLALKTSL